MEKMIRYHEVEDPKHESEDLRDLIKEAMKHPEISNGVSKILEDGKEYGHKVLRWDAGWRVVEEYLGERLGPYKHVDLYARQQKLRSVMRGRLEIDKKWRLTGNKAKRLTQKTA